MAFPLEMYSKIVLANLKLVKNLPISNQYFKLYNVVTVCVCCYCLFNIAATNGCQYTKTQDSKTCVQGDTKVLYQAQCLSP